MTEDPRPEYIPFGTPEPQAPPLHNLEIEQGFLGVLLFDNHVFHDLADGLKPEDFHEPFHQRVYEVIGKSIRAGRVAEPTVIAEALVDDPAFAQFGGLRYLIDLFDQAPPSVNAKEYARLISDLSMRREMVRVAAEMTRMAADRSTAAIEHNLAAEQMVADVSDAGGTESSFEHVATVYGRQFKRSRETDGATPGVPMGIAELDEKMGGLRRKNQVLLGGRPGMAKSAEAIEIALHVAKPTAEYPKGQGVAFFSLEMPEEQLATRFGCALAYDREIEQKQNPTYEDFEKGKLNDIQWRKLEDAGRTLATLPIEINFKAKMKVSQIVAAARAQKRKWAAQGIPFTLMIVDHLHKVAPEKRINDRVQEISQISDDLLDAAKDLDVAQVVLCQLGREVDKRDDKRPELTDLKGSGSLEENAAAVVFVYRPEYYNKEPEPEAPDKKHAEYQRVKQRYTNRIIFIVGKNRNGRANFSVEAFCDIGCNVIQNLKQPIPENRTIDFSKSRIEDIEREFAPPEDDYLDIPD